MADQMTDLELQKAVQVIGEICDEMYKASKIIEKLAQALEAIVEVPNNAASDRRAVSEMVKIALVALEPPQIIHPAGNA